MTFPKRESEPTTRIDDNATELSHEELAAIDGGFAVAVGGCAPAFVASPMVVGGPVVWF